MERLGKYNSLALPGFHWIIPIIDRLYMVNATEQMVDAELQEIITNDNLNASVDAEVGQQQAWKNQCPSLQNIAK
jgi:regulator of protease activity HflC (stomatin/prohibitin superfamily)